MQRTGVVLSTSERWASSVPERMRGLKEDQPLQPGRALIIPRARQVHTFGMNEPIDVLFCDHGWQVIYAVPMMKPRRITRWVSPAYYVIELAGGRAGDVVPGDRLDYVLSER